MRLISTVYSYMVKIINVEPGIVFCRAVKD